MSSIAFSKLRPTFNIEESCLKKSGADCSISATFLSCFIETYVYIAGKIKKGKNNIDDGTFKIKIRVTRIISVTNIKIIIPAKNSDVSVKIDPLSKNSLKESKYFSGILFSKISDITLILLNFMDLILILKYIKP
ncbi:hypothetical protein [Methanobrevibacter sp.]|uniref:hypothetical protein n=1 Tax=Methanobrevibacter sp. TaxID=66852 RepID=UPI0025D5D28B|nr:hypothetical protein [Methanobrevibacter sp.]